VCRGRGGQLIAREEGERDTASTVLDVAERLVQRRGFNAFSYADVAAELHLTKAALHYHFPGKAELGEALLSRYAARFSSALRSIDAQPTDAAGKLAAYAELYAEVLRLGRMCLCGILAAEYETLPDRMQSVVVRFFDDNEAWLCRILDQGRLDGTLRVEGVPSDVARTIVATLEGAMLVARPFQDVARFEAAARSLVAGMATGER
jgi:TetR/AcrR family transcriptional repressor of nem operon